MKKIKFILCVLLAGAGIAQAAEITWGANTQVVNTSDVSTSGTLKEAFTLSFSTTIPGAGTTTVNGVDFLNVSTPTPFSTPNAAAPGYLNGGDTGDTGYNSLLNTAGYGGVTSGSFELGTAFGTQTGDLVEGQKYEIQIWFVEERTTSGLDEHSMTYGDGEATENTVSVGGAAGTLGQYAIGTFIADDSGTQTITVDGGTADIHLAAYQLRAIPTLGLGPMAERPNILLINVDDMGWGDAGFNYPGSLLSTPHLDTLAAQGCVFSQAYTCAAICGPSRYGLMTGRHSWRTGLGSGNSATLGQMTIDTRRLTLGSLLAAYNYDTAMVGKWGVRFDFRSAAVAAFNPSLPSSTPSWSQIDLNQPILGPELVGFEYTRNAIWMGSGHQWAESGNADYPTGISGLMNTDTEYRLRLGIELAAAVGYLESKGNQVSGTGPVDPKYGQEEGKPFFLYFATGAPHTPITPTVAFQGTSGVDSYGDFVQNLDDTIGQLLQAVEDNGLAGNTLVIFTSDNGPEVAAANAYAYSRAETTGHYSMGPLRGGKRSMHEAGTRVPFVVKWPGQVEAGSTSDLMISQTDLLATFAELLGVTLPDNAGEDSISFLDAILGEAGAPVERDLILHAGSSNDYAIRRDDWALIDKSSYISPSEPSSFRTLIGVPSSDDNHQGSLYDLSLDLRQTDNLYATETVVRDQLLAALESYKTRGRTVPSRLGLMDESFEDPIFRYSGDDAETEVGGVAPGWVGHCDAAAIGGFFTGGLGNQRDQLSLLDETRGNAPDTPSGRQWQVLKTHSGHSIAEVGRNLGGIDGFASATSAKRVIDLSFLLSARRANAREDIFDVRVSLVAGDGETWDPASPLQSMVIDADTNGTLVVNAGDPVDGSPDSVYLKGVRATFDLSTVDLPSFGTADVWLVFTMLGTGSSNPSGQTLIDDISLGDVSEDERFELHLDSGTLDFFLTPRPGYDYTLQHSPDLSAGSWADLADFPENSVPPGEILEHPINLTETALGDRAFFRLGRQ